MASLTQWTLVCANSRRQLRTGKPAVHGVAKSPTDLAAEQQQNHLLTKSQARYLSYFHLISLDEKWSSYQIIFCKDQCNHISSSSQNLPLPSSQGGVYASFSTWVGLCDYLAGRHGEMMPCDFPGLLIKGDTASTFLSLSLFPWIFAFKTVLHEAQFS